MIMVITFMKSRLIKNIFIERLPCHLKIICPQEKIYEINLWFSLKKVFWGKDMDNEHHERIENLGKFNQMSCQNLGQIPGKQE